MRRGIQAREIKTGRPIGVQMRGRKGQVGMDERGSKGLALHGVGTACMYRKRMVSPTVSSLQAWRLRGWWSFWPREEAPRAQEIVGQRITDDPLADSDLVHV